MTWRALAGNAVSLVSASTLPGYVQGAMHSPDYDSPATARIYLATNGKWTPVGAGVGAGVLELRAGHRIYRYHTDASVVEIEYLTPDHPGKSLGEASR